MDAETALYLENLEEYILDESRVVTYKWLSQTLEIHVNLAKRLLETFLKEQKKNKGRDATQLSVTYAVTGIQETKNGTKMTRVAVVNESGLENAKSSMKEVLGQHVFSIQKSTLKDISALFSTDYEITKQNITQSNRFSAIQCESAQVRSREDAERLRESGRGSAPTDKPKVNGFGSNSSSTSSKPARPSSSLTSSAPKAKKGSIAASFAIGALKSKTQEQKKEDDAKKKSPEKKEEKKEEVKKPKAKGMMAFMSQKKTEKPVPSSSGDAKEKTDSKPVEVGKEEEEEEEVDVEVKEEEKPNVSKVKAARSTQREKNKKRMDVSDSDSDEGRHRTVAKKRRRIIQQDSSSSSEEEDEDMDDSPIPPTPPPVAEPIQSDEEEEAPPSAKDQSQERTDTQGTGRRRIRKRVLKSKVSVDEDGCMVTEKVWESESTDASEDEAPPPKPKSPPKKEERDSEDEDGKSDKKKKTKKTTPPSSGGKQASLMSFFKKK